VRSVEPSHLNVLAILHYETILSADCCVEGGIRINTQVAVLRGQEVSSLKVESSRGIFIVEGEIVGRSCRCDC
jgi:hypothetical protein